MMLILNKIFQSIKRGILSILSDGTSKISAMRVMSFLTLFVILGTFIGKNISGNGYVDFGQYSFLIILTIITGKVVSGMMESAAKVKMAEIGIENDPTGRP